ncbi:hypothetical protein FFK22_026730 [Mycobacterium sp. KBS0706]|uniref:hypothetical protein n=1 Tax=Mycobacterium sp. KBS0706 TaxID=2578109 RepID=UPI00110F9850|nr:hypothetical protein [Mycobacterium sp. KBS0706]TSD85643.1 hypothetical protein FFK22_026730 [Mycobacterium sp. KBS0706]
MRIALLIAAIAAFLAGIGAWSFAITGDLAGIDGGRAVRIAAAAAVAAVLLIGGFVVLILRGRSRDRKRR